MIEKRGICDSWRRHVALGAKIPAHEGAMGAGNSCRNHPAPKRPRMSGPSGIATGPNQISSTDKFDESILISSTVAKCIRADARYDPATACRASTLVRKAFAALLALLTFPLRSSRVHFCGFNKLVREEVLNALWQRDAC
jgi:hypothetical protein